MPENDSAVAMLENGSAVDLQCVDPASDNILLCGFVPWRELKLQFRLAAPMIFVNLFLFGIQLISVMFVGHLGELALSRATVATSFANVVGLSVLMGTSTALDTLCGQAYGARRYQLMNVYFQRGLIVMNGTAIPLAVIYWFVGDLLVALGQEAEIASGAGEYTRLLIPTLFAYASCQAHIRFLLAQSLVFPMVCCAFATLVCQLTVCWGLIYESSFGFRGAAIATSISYWINLLLLASYVRFSKACRKTRSGLTWEAFRDLMPFIKIAIPSAGMICMEWWCYELLVLLAGLLPNPELQTSALAICLNTGAFMFQIPFGIGAALSTRVSNELGAGNPQAARQAVKVAVAIALSVISLVAIPLLAIRKIVGRIYSDDDEVIVYVAKIVPMLAGATVLDCLQATLSGAARGCGLQRIGAFINLGSYYLVGLPIGAAVGFTTSLQGQGLWLAALCAPFVQSTSLIILMWRMDWDKQASEAQARSMTKESPLKEQLLLK